jgi:glutathione S-transferase
MKLYYIPLSTYSQKVLIALYEKGVPFTPEIVSLQDPAGRAEYLKVNPFAKVPTLVLDDGNRIPESSNIIQYLEDHFEASGTRLIPADKDVARQARFHDRAFDLYVNDKVSTLFFDGLAPADKKNPRAVAEAKATLDTAFAMYDHHFAKHTWAAGEDFTIADCAAAPTLAYARQFHPFAEHKNLTAYVGRLVERPSFARVLAEAAPHMAKFMAAR